MEKKILIRGREKEGFYSYKLVKERLVEALQLWLRMPDGDSRFGLHGKISSLWRQYIPETAFVDVVTLAPRALRPGRADIGRMQEATDWITMIPERDRRMVLQALGWLAADQRVPWIRLWDEQGRGRPGPDGLRKRFDASITVIANGLNAASEQG
jgi:hypothetical protein